MERTISICMKRAIAALLVLAMILASAPAMAYAEDETGNNDIAYIYSEEGRGSLEYYVTRYDGSAKTPAVTITGLTEGTDFEVAYSANTESGYAKVTITGIGAYTGKFETYFLIQTAAEENAERLFGSATRLRYQGATRYDTSLSIADALKEAYVDDKFENIIVAYGGNYPDALSAGYLAKVKNAPIITSDKKHETSVMNYIEANLVEGGTVYILGGTGQVSAAFEAKLVENESFNCKRLEGVTRYETNLLALKEAGVSKEAILVCSGTGYADSLSASAAGLPILLVGKTLTAEQKSYLASLESNYFYAIGGYRVVSTGVVASIKNISNAAGQSYTGTRIAGSTRYETSRLVAEEFFEEEIDNVVLTYGKNFPDGLSGGPLAMAIGAPVVLAANDAKTEAKKYVASTWIKRSVTLGDTTLLSNSVVNSIMTY
ncbi:MAG: cell wall-binding repeat-containing protein [Firmicutes bacterium]|nr:cell wall-binding repeat-containing protein [Bacillota bacterium]